MKIELSQGKFAIVDDADFESLNRWRWFVSHGYAARNEGNTTVRMHRQLMNFPESHVDHINGDRLDNRRCNLRLATNAENSRNREKQSNNTSGVIGVHWHKPRKKWLASVQVDGKRKHLGLFDNIFDAMIKVDEYKLKQHGEFARTNLPKSYYTNLSRYRTTILAEKCTPIF